MSEHEQPPLQHSLAELSPVLATDRSIGDSLHRVSRLAVDAVAPAMFAGITMIVNDQVTTQAFTDPTCPHIDQAQYESGDGPCLEAFTSGSVVLVDDLDSDGRWPEFASAATANGVRSTLSLPLLSGDESLGALNLYADAEGAFDEKAIEIGRTFAERATVVLLNAQAYWGARLTSEDLDRKLAARQVIDVAKGVIMSALRCTPGEAFDRLVEQSVAENRDLSEVAADIVADAQRRRS